MSIKCPYCLEPIDKQSVTYACPQCGKTYKAAGLFHNKVPVCHNRTVHASSLLASTIVCPHKGCGQTLPTDLLDYSKSLKFSLVGTTNSGKTNFLIVMLHELMHTLKTGLAISPLDSTRDYYKNFRDFEKRMYESHALLRATNQGSVDPYLWRIRDKNKAKGNTIPSYSLTIYDGAGENFNLIDVKELTVISKYLCDTDTLFILVDPLQLRSIKERGIGGESVTYDSKSDDATSSLQKVAEYIRVNKGLRTNELIDMNVAIIFTKIDALTDEEGNLQFGDGDLILQRSDASHIGCFDFRKKAFDSNMAGVISESIRNFIYEEEPAFANVLESYFVQSKVQFFAISALGNKPERDERGEVVLRHIDPIRVLDPFLWMMMKEGLIAEVK